MNVSDYILEYEHLYQNMMQHDMKLPDAIFTSRLLDGAQVTDDQRKLALTMSSNLNFEGVKSALKRLSHIQHVTNMMVYKLNKKKHFVAKNTICMVRNKVHSSYRKPNNKLNPPNNKDQISRCIVCDSKMHWANNCPHNTQSVNVLEDDVDKCEELNIVLMT